MPIPLIRDLDPDVVLLDVHLPDGERRGSDRAQLRRSGRE